MLPPISLYIHFPWCIQKCPYCDFNSHQSPSGEQQKRPDERYVAQLLENLAAHQHDMADRPIHSIFIGGGTPSLTAPNLMHTLLNGIDQRLHIPSGCEITLEANPGASDASYFAGYRAAGINRLSIGIQSFNQTHLKRLGRVHSNQEAKDAVHKARRAGFDNLNIDIMFGLPEQSLAEAMSDLQEAFSLNTPHFSWYQLTLEPHTAFYANPPTLPQDELIVAMHEQGIARIIQAGYEHYEVSAYAKQGYRCQHNMHYWLYGDYLGIGAGAHSKMTRASHSQKTILRFSEARSPQRYLTLTEFGEQYSTLTPEQIRLEYMMNVLRLEQPINLSDYETHTGLDRSTITEAIHIAAKAGWMTNEANHITLTDQGRRFLNDVILLF